MKGWTKPVAIGLWAAALWLPEAAAGQGVEIPTPEATPESSFTVLCYHRFVARPETVRKPLSEYRLPMQEFRWQLQYLKDQGIKPVSMDQLKAYWFEGKPLPDKAVLLTFDDGFRSIYEKAYPAVKEFGYPGVLFLYTDFIRGQSDSLRYSEIEEMQKNGFDVESHTKSHLNLGLEGEKRKPALFAQLLNTELKDPLQFLREKFGVQSEVLAYSYGVFNQEVLKKTKEAGYQLAFTVNPGPNDRTVHPLKLRRNLILFPISHESFKKIFADKVLHLQNFTPGDGDVIWDDQPDIQGVILDEVVPQTLAFHLGSRKIPFHYDPKTHLLHHQVPSPLRAGGHLLMLSAVDLKGQKRVYSWYFRVKHRNLGKAQEEEENKAQPAPKLQESRKHREAGRL